MVIRAKLDTWVTLEKPQRSIDAGGGRPREFVVVDSFWTDFRPTNSREATVAAQRSLEVSHVFRCRYRDDLSTNMRIRLEGRIFSIVSFQDPTEDGDYLDITTMERKDLDTGSHVVVSVYPALIAGSAGIASAEAFGTGGVA